MLNSRSSEDKRIAIKYLLDQKKWEILKPLVQRDMNYPVDLNAPMRAFVRGEIKRNHYKITKIKNDVIFQKIKTK